MVSNTLRNIRDRVEERANKYVSRVDAYMEPRLPPHVLAMKPRPSPTPPRQWGPPSGFVPPPQAQMYPNAHGWQQQQQYPVAPPVQQNSRPQPSRTRLMPRRPMQILTPQDIHFFKEHGYIKIPSCFTSYQCSMLMGDLWQRMGVSPDKQTWHKERFDVEGRDDFSLQEFAPKAWAAICDLLGGEERLGGGSHYWDDSFIVNLGTPEGEGKFIQPDGWHVDGDFFSHYLDSPEQALLVLPLFTDVRSGGGATALCPAATTEIAQFLYEHPEGVSPDLVPRAEDPYWNREPDRWRVGEIVEKMGPRSFIEATGNAGDVYFLHPLMAHSASNNMLRELRVINNPNVELKQPFCFDRADGDYSVVELATLNFLRRNSLRGWRITGTRDKISPEQRKWERGEEPQKLNQTKPQYAAAGWYVGGHA